jgi:hypothetical protein
MADTISKLIIVIVVLVFLFVIIYPLYISRKLWRRGLQNEAIILIFTSVIGLGCILTIKYKLKRPTIKQMSLYENCPECGYSYGYFEEKNINTETGMEALSYGAIIFWVIWSAICLLLSFVFIITIIKLSFNIIELFLLIIFIAGTVLGIKPLYENFKSDREIVNEYYCGKCDNIWNKYYRR